MSNIWSNTDFPYMCLKDKIRTEAFGKAIAAVVNKGDVVVDIGTGSGILSFLAAKAGASHVYSVEIDPLLVKDFRKSIQANGFEKIIEIIEGDARNAELPMNCDVLIAEIIDTGLIEELQVPVLNILRKKGVIGSKTRLIPSKYITNLQLVYSDNRYYGFTIYSPKHEWPFYNFSDTNWESTNIERVSDIVVISSVNFMSGEINENVKEAITFKIPQNKKCNGIRISGILTLANGIEIGPTNALNGDKILSIDMIEGIEKVTFEISYTMGGGLNSFNAKMISYE